MIRYYYHRTRTLLNQIIGLFFFRSKNSLIVMLHHVLEQNDTKISSSCQSTLREFEIFLQYVVKNKNVVSLDEFVLLRAKRKLNNNLVITFDDVPNNFYSNAYPLLKKYDLPFTLYITVQYLEKEGCLSKENLLELIKDPNCTIGSHTLSHPKLSDINIDTLREIKLSKELLEKIIQREVKHFAYPYGGLTSVSSKNKHEVERCNYASAVSSVPGIINNFSRGNLYYLPRCDSNLYMKLFSKY